MGDISHKQDPDVTMAGPEAEAPTLESAGLTQQDLDTTLKVLAVMAENTALYQSKPLKQLRKAVVPFADRLPNLSQLDAKTRAKQNKLQQKQRKQAQIAEDQRRAERTALRQGRLQKLQALQEQGDETSLMVLDGTACDFLHVEGQATLGDSTNGVPQTSNFASASDAKPAATTSNVNVSEKERPTVTEVDEEEEEEREAKRLRKCKACYICTSFFSKLNQNDKSKKCFRSKSLKNVF